MNNQLMKIEFTDDQVSLIKSQIAKDCATDELKLFLYQCKRTGLDPLTRQIYAIKRSGRMTIQTSIDGFRVIAERSGSYAGQDEPVWVDDEQGMPIKCTVKVYRFAPSGERFCAGVGVAYFKEYYPNPMNLQKSMPHTMIAKVAEALALRKAYPQDLSGLYTSDEMSQAEPKREDEFITPVDQDFSDIPAASELQLLRDMVFSSTLDEAGRMAALEQIEKCNNYSQYQKIQYRLEELQKGFDDVTNPSATDAKNMVKKITSAA
jgi:phage recombination protein Bet